MPRENSHFAPEQSMAWGAANLASYKQNQKDLAQISRILVSRVSLGFLKLIEDITTEETRSATCSGAKGRRACNSSNDCSASRPNGPAAQYSLLGIRHAGTANGEQKWHQERDYHLPHFYPSPVLNHCIDTAELKYARATEGIHGQNNHFHVVYCATSAEL